LSTHIDQRIIYLYLITPYRHETVSVNIIVDEMWLWHRVQCNVCCVQVSQTPMSMAPSLKASSQGRYERSGRRTTSTNQNCTSRSPRSSTQSSTHKTTWTL